MGESLEKKSGCVFPLTDATRSYKGCIADTVSFFEREQLMEASLWKSFVAQYRDQIDGENRGWRGEYWGKMMRGAAMVYEYSRNQELYRVLTETVEDMLTVAEADGRVSSFSRDTEFGAWDLWCRKYVLLGMEYYYGICSDESLKSRILSFLCGCADYIVAHIGNEGGQKKITLASGAWLGVNSSSILEPFVRLYCLTYEQRYLDFSAYIVENGGAEGINIFELAYENKLYPYQYGVSKAYEMISCFEGLIEYYLITGIEKYKTAAINFGKAIMDSDVTVIGSCGCTHELFDHSKNRQTAYYEGIMQETCVTVTWMKYCARLLQLTGESVFADCMEHSFYNAYLGALNTEHKDCPYIREKFVEQMNVPNLKYTYLPVDSYSPLTPGVRGQKVGGLQLLRDGSYYGCCTSIAAAGVGTFLQHAVMTDREGIVINFFEAGYTELSYRDTRVVIRFETAYPTEGRVKIGVHTDSPIRFALKIRLPEWSSQYQVTADSSCILQNGYLTVDWEWSGEREVVVDFDMCIHVIRPVEWDTDVIYTERCVSPYGHSTTCAMSVTHAEADDHYIALSRGPLTLAADSRMGKAASSAFSFQKKDGDITCRVCDDREIVDGKNCLVKCEFTSETGEVFHLIDYASAGRDWETEIAAWLPTC